LSCLSPIRTNTNASIAKELLRGSRRSELIGRRNGWLKRRLEVEWRRILVKSLREGIVEGARLAVASSDRIAH
jgi:hypothetical protein